MLKQSIRLRCPICIKTLPKDRDEIKKQTTGANIKTY